MHTEGTAWVQGGQPEGWRAVLAPRVHIYSFLSHQRDPKRPVEPNLWNSLLQDVEMASNLNAFKEGTEQISGGKVHLTLQAMMCRHNLRILDVGNHRLSGAEGTRV